MPGRPYFPYTNNSFTHPHAGGGSYGPLRGSWFCPATRTTTLGRRAVGPVASLALDGASLPPRGAGPRAAASPPRGREPLSPGRRAAGPSPASHGFVQHSQVSAFSAALDFPRQLRPRLQSRHRTQGPRILKVTEYGNLIKGGGGGQGETNYG